MSKKQEDRAERKYYTAGPGKPPIFVQAIIDSQKMSAIDFFHITDAYLDWDKAGDDAAVLEPLIAFLAQWGDELIYAFDDTMAELLYTLDTKKIARDVYKDDHFSADEFLYIRCTALVNSKRFYNDIVKGRRKMKGDLEFEAILYVPSLAWARRHGGRPEDYPHITEFCYETMSNVEGVAGSIRKGLMEAQEMDIQYRQARTDDLDGIVSLVGKAVDRMASQGIDQWDKWYPVREDFEQDIGCGGLTVGMQGEEIAVIYTINGEYEPEYKNAEWKNPNKSFCILHRLCVNPVFQNRGIARQTMEHIEQEAAAKGIQAIRLDVFSQNPHALKLYRNSGFEKVGTAQWRKGLFYLMEKYLA